MSGWANWTRTSNILLPGQTRYHYATAQRDTARANSFRGVLLRRGLWWEFGDESSDPITKDVTENCADDCAE